MNKLKVAVLIIFFVLPICTAFAAPTIAISPNGSPAVRLDVTTFGEASFIFKPFGENLAAPGRNENVTVQFDIYRSGTWLQNLWWSATDAQDNQVEGNPTYGVQWDFYGPPNERTFPFYQLTSPEELNQRPATIRDAFATVKIEWDFKNGLANSWYNGQQVDINHPISNFSVFEGWDITLHLAAESGGSNVAWVDNFMISADDPYLYETNFDNFTLGDLDGQDGWLTHSPTATVPVPATLFLFGSGLIGLAGFRKKSRI
jgi:hypothetical protein